MQTQSYNRIYGTEQTDEINPHIIFKIIIIQGLTGLQELEQAFENPLNLTDNELIINFLERKYTFESGDPYNFIINIARFSRQSLKIIEANEPEFYYNMLIPEALDVILTKILKYNDNKNNINGFPTEFNISLSQIGNINYFEGNKIFPSKRLTNNLSFIRLLQTIKSGLKLNDEDFMLFHGTSWDSASSIMNGIDIVTRSKTTDFGFENFYLSDSFKSSYYCAKKNLEPAIVIYVIPNSNFDEFADQINLQNDSNWKRFIYKIRNPPKPRSLNYKDNIKKYKDCIKNIDSHDLITGPICANPYDEEENLTPIKYGDEIPFQFSFKRSSIDRLHEMYAITIFFERE